MGAILGVLVFIIILLIIYIAWQRKRGKLFFPIYLEFYFDPLLISLNLLY